MKTKYKTLILFFLIFMIDSEFNYSQDIDCATGVQTGLSKIQIAPYGDSSVLETYVLADTVSIKTVIHIVRYSDGTGGISETTVNLALDTLNKFFQSTKIKFIRFAIHYINNNTYANLNVPETFCTSAPIDMFTLNNVTDALNIYFVPHMSYRDANLRGAAQSIPGSGCAVINDAALLSTLAHEVGHCFGLYHTHETCLTDQREHITRTGLYPCTPNFDDAGDFLKDTPADPNLQNFPPSPDGTFNYQDYQNLPDDGCGYINYHPLVNNIMSYRQPLLRNAFTPEQRGKIVFTLQNSFFTCYYKVNVILSNKIDTVNQPNTTLLVDGQQTNSGMPISLMYGVTHLSKTNHEILSSNYKHHDWDNDNTQYKLGEKYQINLNNKIRNANFIQLNTVNCLSTLSEVQNNNSGTINLLDPWWVDGTGNQPGTYQPLSTSFPNLFLNQTPDPNDPNKPYYSVKVEQGQNIYLSQTAKTHKFYLNNWSVNNSTYATFQNANSYSTAVVFNSSAAVVTANLKGTQLSSQTNANAGSGQRKFVKTSDGYLHQVYESLNKIYYERSINNGTTWEIMNGGAPVSGNAKQPSIDFYNTATDKVVVIVYEAYSSSTVNLIAAIYKNGVSQQSYGLALYTGMIQEDVDALNCRPVVSISSDGKILIVWYNDGELTSGPNTGLNYKYGNLYNYYGIRWMINWYTPSPVLMSSTSYFTLKNPTLSVYKSAVQPFQLAYEKDNVIYYRTLTDNVNYINHIQEGTVQNISSGSGFSFNKNPSILAWNGGSRVVWEGNNNGYKKKIIFRSPSYSYFWSFNSNGGAYDCINPNINRPDNYSTYYFSWSENNQVYMDNNTLSASNMKYLGISGQDIQLSNGATPGTMYATTLKTLTTPYYFTQSASLGSFYGLSKSSEIFAGSEGRRGVVYKDSAEFYFNFGKLMVDDNNIGYVKIDEGENVLDKENLNNYLISQPFVLSDSSNFTFNVQYGVTDTASAMAVLGDDDYISFKLQLVDKQTSAIIGEYDNVKFSKNNLSAHNNLNYKVNTNGIGNRSVILKLVVTNNFESNYSLTLENSGNADEMLFKESYQEISYNGNLTITKYALAQNFPNPFNPSTTIRYELPKDGLVTLKIYDILGSEIATLVKEEKIAGKYEVNFNASSLASGVYIYKLQAGEFVSSKKMLLLK